MKKVILASVLALLIAGIVRPRPVLTHAVVNTTVSYDREIVRILKKKCLACHSENNLGVPLTTYEETRPWAIAIHEEALQRHMPPWRAVPGYGDFINDGSLTSRELQFLIAWIDGNGPKSKEQRLVVNVDQGETGETDRLKLDLTRWQLGKPDSTRLLPATLVGAGEGDFVRRVVVDLGLREDRRVRALEFRPGDRRLIRAAFFYLESTGQWLGSWTPWYGVTSLPSGVAYLVPAGARVVAEIHYRSAPVAAEDRTSNLGLYFAPRAGPVVPADLLVESRPAPHAKGELPGIQKLSGMVRLAQETTILAFKPTVQDGVDSFVVTARKPNGAVRVLLLVRQPLVEWPTPYVLKDPVRLAAGTEVSVTYLYRDNAGAAMPALPLAISVTTQPASTVLDSRLSTARATPSP